MINRKLWMKAKAAMLAGVVAASSFYGMPIVTFAEASSSSLESRESGLIDFTSKTPEAAFEVNKETGIVTVGKKGGDHFVVYDGLEKKTNDFVLEADVDLKDGPSAALIFGFGDKNNPGGSGFCGANIDTTREKDTFRLFGGGIPDTSDEKGKEGIDTTKTLHLKIDVKRSGAFTYSFGNKDGEERTIEGTFPNWQGGYVGILTWETEAEFSNISFENRMVESGTIEIEAGENYKTNLQTMTAREDSEWRVTEEGLYSNAVDKGDSFLYSQSVGENFVYSTEVTFKNKTKGAATLVFRSNNNNEQKESYAANLDIGSKKCKLWRWQKGSDYQLVDEEAIEPTENGTYVLKVVAVDEWVSYYVNDVLVASAGDYYMQMGESNKGQSTFLEKGYFGLLNWNGEMVFQNTYYKEINSNFTPLLQDIKVTSLDGDVEAKPQFFPTEPVSVQFVKNNAKTVKIEAVPVNKEAVITVKDEKGNVYKGAELDRIPVEEGRNYLTVESRITEGGTEAVLTYRVDVHRRQVDEIYYNELYRGQYHYSVKDGWGNDPNGMVYYKGKYHFFYQFYDATYHGGYLLWGHATSTDLITWEEQPVALYPDANGAMFSGCAVADTENTSGLFDGIEGGGLVALITEDGNGQRIKVAYSTDEGMTWTKIDKIAADWTDDPLHDGAFRDPKVFRWENKWFMVIAGGPLRIYSSDDLLSWKCESTYASLHTECPDLYPLQADDGTIKWVLSRGGRYYKIGDFKEVDGNWRFVPDEAYAGLAGAENDGVMNFGNDSYAAMTYYVQDFGTSENPTLPKDLIESNWMNTWDDYCNQVADKVGQKFNGTYNLNLKLGIVKEDGKYVLTQTPIQGYETLRDTEKATKLEQVEVSENNDLLKDFEGDCYEIVSHFTPAEDTKKIGFRVRTGGKEETTIVYDLETEVLSIDRSKSGVIISPRFARVDAQKNVKKNADGSIDLHIYVDRASVEVFTKGNTVTGGDQIFPSISSRGASVFVEGGTAKADIAIYPMNTIWKDKKNATEPIAIESTTASEMITNIGDKIDLGAYLLPVGIAQEMEWSVEDESIASIKPNNTTAKVTALKAGTTKIYAAAKENPSLKKEFTIEIFENNFDTNIPSFVNNGGNWMVRDDTLSVSNTSRNDSYMTSKNISEKEYILETDIMYTKGLINVFFASNGTNPERAYSLQFGDSENIRLFRFAVDGTIKEESMGKRINDGEYHHIKVEKTLNSVTVSVDGKECLTYTFEEVEDFYNNAYIGLGLWDGALSVKSFRTNTEEVDEEAEKLKAAKEELEKALEAAKAVVDKGQQKYTNETWKAFLDAYKEAEDAVDPETAIDAEALKKLTEALKSAQTALKENNTGSSSSSTSTNSGSSTSKEETNKDNNETANPEPDKNPDADQKNTETKEDGTVVETVVTTAEDGTKTQTVTETRTDGTKTETVTETAKDGTVLKERVTETAKDGSAVATTKATETNSAGTIVSKVVTEQIAATGAVTKTTEEASFTADKADVVVTTVKDEKGSRAAANISKQGTSSGSSAEITLSNSIISQIAEAANTDDVDVTVSVVDNSGKELYTLTVHQKDLASKDNLYLYKYNAKTKDYVMVNAKKYSTEGSGITVKAKAGSDYTLLNKEDMNRVSKAIIKTVKLAKSSKAVKAGKTCKVNLNKKANKESIKTIAYTTSNKKAATVSKNGTVKVKAKASGTVKIKAKVTMKNGKTKTLVMKVKVK